MPLSQGWRIPADAVDVRSLIAHQAVAVATRLLMPMSSPHMTSMLGRSLLAMLSSPETWLRVVVRAHTVENPLILRLTVTMLGRS